MEIGKGLFKILSESLATSSPNIVQVGEAVKAASADVEVAGKAYLEGVKKRATDPNEFLNAVKRAVPSKDNPLGEFGPGQLGHGLVGLIKGQSIYRGTSVKKVPESISRRFDEPAHEFGTHVSVDPKTAELMQYNYDTGVKGSIVNLESKVSKPLKLPDTHGTWPPDAVISSIRQETNRGNIRFSNENINKLKELQKEFETKTEDFFVKNKTYTSEQFEKYKEKLDSEYAKKTQRIIKEEGYDHISYINKKEGAEVESAIIFDRSDVEVKK